jgi:hypothetical protein
MKFFRKRIIHNFKGDPYLVRYTLFSCKWFGVFLHKIMRSDSDRDLHDHPWSFWTFLLAGRYTEDVPLDNPPMYKPNGCMYTRPRIFAAGSLVRHRAEDAHCLTLPRTWRWDGLEGSKEPDGFIPVWSLFIHGPRRREWGFHTAAGWIPWETYVNRYRDTDLAPMEDC